MKHFNKLLISRVNNAKLNRREMRKGEIVLKSRPTCIMLPIGQTCNLECSMCAINRKSVPIEKLSNMSLSKFQTFQPVIGNAYKLALYDHGEPLTNPAYEEIIEDTLAKYPDVVLFISTNGILMKDYWRRRFTSINNLLLNVSVNAATRTTYEKIMGKDMFLILVSNLKKLVKLKGKSKFPIIILSFVLQEENILELPEFVTFAGKIGVNAVAIWDLIKFTSQPKQLAVIIDKDLTSIYLEAKKRADKAKILLIPYANISYFPTEYGKLCRDPWESFRVSFTGDVFICCYNGTSYGNIFKQSFNEIWNSEKLQHLRATVNTDNMLEICRICPKKLEYTSVK